jgi:hypothetical protein
MPGIDKELDPVFNQYKKKREETMEKGLKEQEASHAREEEFKNVFETKVYPVMLECLKYLRSKGNEFEFSSISTDPHFAGITFTLDFFALSEMSRSAKIKFSRKDDGVRIVETNGRNKDTVIEKAELTPEFVTTKLTDFIKSFLNNS